MEFLIPYLITVNALGLLLMLADKQKARKKRWRIPEATLMGVASIGGSAVVFLGMYLFRHKTRHPKFTVGVPLLLILHGVLLFLILRRS